MAQPVRMLNIGLRCNCDKEFPILAEEFPLVGFYVCVNCDTTFSVKIEVQDELSDT